MAARKMYLLLCPKHGQVPGRFSSECPMTQLGLPGEKPCGLPTVRIEVVPADPTQVPEPWTGEPVK